MAIGREVLKGATNLLDDIQNDAIPKEAFKRRGNEVFNSLKKSALSKISGSGYKRSVNTLKKIQLNSKRQKRQTSSAIKRKKKNPKKKLLKKKKKQPKKSTQTVKRKSKKKTQKFSKLPLDIFN